MERSERHIDHTNRINKIFHQKLWNIHFINCWNHFNVKILVSWFTLQSIDSPSQSTVRMNEITLVDFILLCDYVQCILRHTYDNSHHIAVHVMYPILYKCSIVLPGIVPRFFLLFNIFWYFYVLWTLLKFHPPPKKMIIMK